MFPNSHFVGFVGFVPRVQCVYLESQDPYIGRASLRAIALVLRLSLSFFLSLRVIRNVTCVIYRGLFSLGLVNPCVGQLLHLGSRFYVLLPSRSVRNLGRTTSRKCSVGPLRCGYVFTKFRLVRYRGVFCRFVRLKNFVRGSVTVRLSTLEVVEGVFFWTFYVTLSRNCKDFRFVKCIVRGFLSRLISLSLILGIALRFVVYEFRFASNDLRL